MDVPVAELRAATDHDPALVRGVRVRSPAPRAPDPVRAEGLLRGEDLVGQHTGMTLRALRALVALGALRAGRALRSCGSGCTRRAPRPPRADIAPRWQERARCTTGKVAERQRVVLDVRARQRAGLYLRRGRDQVLLARPCPTGQRERDGKRAQ